jgi:hypothetical protein
MNLSERRGMERFPLDIEFCQMSCVDSVERVSEDLLIENICSGGAFIKTEKQLPVGTDVTIDMILSLKGVSHFSLKKSHISVVGAVIRTGEKGMAISFGSSYKITPYNGDLI